MSKHKLFAAIAASIMCLTLGGFSAFAEEYSETPAADPDPIVSEDPAPVEDPQVSYEDPVEEPVDPEPQYDPPSYDDSSETSYSDNSSSYEYSGDDEVYYYYDSDGNSYTDQNEVYVGGGQSYEPPLSTAPSAALYKTGKVSEDTMSSGDWSDIASRLKNANADDDDADDFAAIQNNTGAGDNGHWMIIAGIACLLLSLTGFIYFIASSVSRRRALGKRTSTPASASQTAQRSRYRDDYNDGYKSEKPSKKSSGGRRYR